jgi:hypothetical protein
VGRLVAVPVPEVRAAVVHVPMACNALGRMVIEHRPEGRGQDGDDRQERQRAHDAAGHAGCWTPPRAARSICSTDR